MGTDCIFCRVKYEVGLPISVLRIRGGRYAKVVFEIDLFLKSQIFFTPALVYYECKLAWPTTTPYLAFPNCHNGTGPTLTGVSVR